MTQTSKVSVRALRLSDSDLFQEIAESINSEAKEANMLPVTVDEIRQDIDAGLCCVALDGATSKVVGYGSITVWNDEYGEFRSLWVNATYRGRGIAKRLVEHREDIILSKGLKPIVLVKATNVIGMYTSLGYTEIDKSTLPHYFWTLCSDCAEHGSTKICCSQAYGK
jgi:N-acetylglutamate synthase-like GNAT family acetyltransferase